MYEGDRKREIVAKKFFWRSVFLLQLDCVRCLTRSVASILELSVIAIGSSNIHDMLLKADTKLLFLSSTLII